MLDARVTLAIGLALTAIAVAIVLSHSPQVLAGTNAIKPLLEPALTSVPGGGSACQANETLPVGSSAIRLSLNATAGPRIAVNVLSGKTVITHGEGTPGWIGSVVTIPVVPLDHAVRHTTVCFAFTGANERVSFLGVPTHKRSAATSGAHLLPGRIAIEYLRPGSSSWWSLALSVARHMGLGRAWAGTWIVLLVATLMATSIAFASWLTIRESR
jgi:hypothetical protein